MEGNGKGNAENSVDEGDGAKERSARSAHSALRCYHFDGFRVLNSLLTRIT